MSNGFGPLLQNLDTIRYEDREYRLGCSWTSAENYVEIHGLDSNQPAGPFGYGGHEIDCDLGLVILPSKAACKIAAAILYAELVACRDNIATPLCNAFPNADVQGSFTRVLKRILADELDREPEQYIEQERPF